MTYIVAIATVALFFLVFDNALAGKHQSDYFEELKSLIYI